MLERVYKVERTFTAWATAAMGLFVFLDVVHRVATRDRSLTASIVITVAAFIVTFLALRTRKTPASTAGQLAGAVVIVAGAAGALRAFVWALPNGLVWSQTLGLILMLWVAVVGASMATHEHRHLALDVGSKVWPKSFLPHVQAAGNAITAAFCFFLAAVAVVSLRKHYGDWQDTDGAGGHFAALAVPKFVAFAVIPVGFSLMGVRFLGQAIAAWRGKVEEDDAMHMLGLDADVVADAAAPPHEQDATS